MSAMPQTGAFRHQDGQILCEPQDGDRSHAQYRWDHRCPPEWRGYNIRAAWREAEQMDVHIGEGSAARYHTASGMVIVSAWGFIQTAAPATYFEEVLDEI